MNLETLVREMLEFFSSDIGKVALGGLIAVSGQFLVSILGWIKEARFAQKKRRQEAEYLAMRIVLAFDDLVGAIYNAVHDPLMTDDKGYTESTVADPSLVMPSDGDYKALPAQLMYEVLSMPNRLDGIKESLSSVSEYADPPDYEVYYEYRRAELSKLGLKALDLIDALCRKYDIPPPERPEHYTPRSSFNEELVKIARLNDERSRSRRGIEELMGASANTSAPPSVNSAL